MICTSRALEAHKRHVEKAIFEYFYKKYYNRIRSYCQRRFGASRIEEDAIQDAFLYFWARGIKQVNLIQCPEAYLRTITRNVLYHTWIKKDNSHVRFENLQHHAGKDPYATQRGFYELISPLDDEEKCIVELCYLHGYNRHEAARKIRVSKRTCFRRLQHAKQKLSRIHGCGGQGRAEPAV